jgi:hypothetical protein
MGQMNQLGKALRANIFWVGLLIVFWAVLLVRRSSDDKEEKEALELWTTHPPSCTVAGNLEAVHVGWRRLQGATAYKLFFSRDPRFADANPTYKLFDTRSPIDYVHRVPIREGPMYYYVVAQVDGREVTTQMCVAQLLPMGVGKCQLCGAKAVGYCEMRRIDVCDADRYFTDLNGKNWQCP